MHGTMDKHGNVTITFSMNEERLQAPGDTGQQYLPCTMCGRVDIVEINIVAHLCDSCYNVMLTEHAEEAADIENGVYAAQYAYASGYPE